MTTIQQFSGRSQRLRSPITWGEDIFPEVNLGITRTIGEPNIAQPVRRALGKHSERSKYANVTFAERGAAAGCCSAADQQRNFATAEPADELSEERDAANFFSVAAVDLSAETRLGQRIREAIRLSPGLHEYDIAVEITGTEVVLSGTVQISLQKRLAEMIAHRLSSLNLRDEILVKSDIHRLVARTF